MSTVSIRLPDKMVRELERMAAGAERPKSYFVRKALETYLIEYADYQLARERLHDRDDQIISGSELRKRLGL
jgi:RHH-type rel operon transcriptional repressor/antitoxin RelB